METALNDLELILKTLLATDEFLKQVNHDTSGHAFFDSFLENDDKDMLGMHRYVLHYYSILYIIGIPVKHYEDWIFTTSMEANTFLCIWRDGFKLSADTPTLVSTTVKQLCGWLTKNTLSLSGEYKP